MTQHRNTLLVETAQVLEQIQLADAQYQLRLRCPDIADMARPGHFLHIQCDPVLPMRRPMSIMRTHPSQGSLDMLYRVQGQGTQFLSRKKPGDTAELIGPIGKPFKLSGYRDRPLLIGGGLGIPPIFFLSEHIHKRHPDLRLLVLLGSESRFPFNPRPSCVLLPGMPAEATAAMPVLDDWGVPSRLCSWRDFAGCYQAHVTDLARLWLQQCDPAQRAQTEIFACGPEPMLRATAGLAAEFGLPCQISVEEYMACAVGGCAGCVIPVHTNAGISMQRVCIEGPVFEAASIYPAT